MNARLCLMVLALGCLGAPPAQAQLPKSFNATVEAVDTKIGTLTVRRSTDRSISITLNLLRPDLPVTDIHDRPLKVSDLRAKDRVVVTLAGDEDVAAIRRESDVLWGVVVHHDAEAKSLVCNFGSVERPIPLNRDVKLVADGKSAGPEAFLPGSAVNVIYTPDHSRVAEVRGGKSITALDPYGRMLSFQAVLTEADHARRRLKVIVTQERYGPREFEYDPWASLMVAHGDGRLGAFPIAGLRPYCRVTVFVESDTQRVFHVSAQLPGLYRRKVLAVDHAARKLTLSGKDDAGELTLAPGALLRGKQGKFLWEDVHVDDFVNCSLSFDGSQILYLHLWPR